MKVPAFSKIFPVCLAALVTGCQILTTLGLAKEEEDNSLALLAALYLVTSSSSSSSSSSCSSSASTGSTILNTAATIGGDGCINGVTTSLDSTLPDWIKNNFACSLVYASGSYYCFKSKNLPNHLSYYWAGKTEVQAGNSGNYPLFQNLGGGQTPAGTNQIASQDFVYSIPASPARDSDGSLTGTQGGLASIGITRNGLAIFNNAAAPGDTLSTEALTFDQFGGHPESTGVQHHHAYMVKFDTAEATLVGIALDGFAVYGEKCDQATSATGDDAVPGDLDSYHGHTKTTTHFTTATYHYHYANDATAGIKTLMGSYFYGNVGSVTN